MPSNGSRLPSRRSAVINNDTDRFDHDHDDDRNGPVSSGDPGIVFRDSSLPIGQSSYPLVGPSSYLPVDPSSYPLVDQSSYLPVDPSSYLPVDPSSYPLVDQSSYLPVGQSSYPPQELGAHSVPRAFASSTSYMFDNSAGQFLSQNMAQVYGSSPAFLSPPGNGYAETGVNNPNYQQASPAFRAFSPAPTHATPPENENLSTYQCQECPGTPIFRSQRELNRLAHSRAHRSETTPLYRCCCGYRQSRRDNYLRHLSLCEPPTSGPYGCNCGEEFSGLGRHEEHVRNCGRIRRSRHSTTS
ncbi:hypothetical protein GGR58DRAFT_99347 [Xylaria digitata]|nr:hypothetical protein GGR58DRAFT_99347 [Xylaria digitata]